MLQGQIHVYGQNMMYTVTDDTHISNAKYLVDSELHQHILKETASLVNFGSH